MAFTREEVKHIAELSRLALEREEIERFTRELSSVLDYVKQLHAVDTSGEDYHYHVAGLEHAVADDVVKECGQEERKRVCDSFPDRAGAYLKVKGVFDTTYDA